MAREQSAPQTGQRIVVIITLRRVKPEDYPKLVEHLEAMAKEWDAAYEVTTRQESQIPPGA